MNTPNTSAPWRRVIKHQPIGGGRYQLTMECGHTADAIHLDTHVYCLTCVPTPPANDLTTERWQRFMQPITNMSGVKDFFTELSKDIAFHPDDTLKGYVEHSTGQPTFSEDLAEVLDERMSECFTICRGARQSVYTVAMNITAPNNTAAENGQWAREHGHAYYVPELITLLFDDISWHNDGCPCFTHKGIAAESPVSFRLWVEHPVVKERGDTESAERFWIDQYENGDYATHRFATNDPLEAITYMIKLAPQSGS